VDQGWLSLKYNNKKPFRVGGALPLPAVRNDGRYGKLLNGEGYFRFHREWPQRRGPGHDPGGYGAQSRG
jgi:hypothetical protein